MRRAFALATLTLLGLNRWRCAKCWCLHSVIDKKGYFPVFISVAFWSVWAAAKDPRWSSPPKLGSRGRPTSRVSLRWRSSLSVVKDMGRRWCSFVNGIIELFMRGRYLFLWIINIKKKRKKKSGTVLWKGGLQNWSGKANGQHQSRLFRNDNSTSDQRL